MCVMDGPRRHAEGPAGPSLTSQWAESCVEYSVRAAEIPELGAGSCWELLSFMLYELSSVLSRAVLCAFWAMLVPPGDIGDQAWVDRRAAASLLWRQAESWVCSAQR